MEYNQIINNMLDILRNQFNNMYSDEEIDFLKNYPLNKFYEGKPNKYQYLLEKYISNNAIEFLREYYSNNKISYETRLNIFKWMYKSDYKFVLFDENFSTVPKEFNDIDLYYDVLSNKKDALAANILSVSEKRRELFFEVNKSIYYKSLNCLNLSKILSNYSSYSNIDIYIYNSMFDYLCESDKYGYYVDNFLSGDCKFLNSINLRSILKNLYLYNKYLVNKEVREKKASVYYSLITDEKIKLIDSGDLDLLLLNIKYFDVSDNFKTLKKSIM